MDYPNTHIMPRPRLRQVLADAIYAHPLTILTAPAGYGKTTIARTLAADPHMNAVNVTASAGPHTPQSIWDDMLEQVANQGLPIASMLRRHGFPGDDAQRRRVIDLCRSDSDPLLLMVDDYHNINLPAIDDFLTTLVSASLPNFRILLLSRAAPPPGFSACSDRTGLLDHGFLAFTIQETVEYFKLHGNNDTNAAKRAWTFSEGWPAALWLCLRSPRVRRRQTAAANINRLLAETVYAECDTEDRDFLMRISVMERATAEEAAMVTGFSDAHARLHDLSKRNAFITRDGTGHYQLHSLFRSFLEEQLTHSGSDRTGLYANAGECLLRRGDLMGAFRFFVRAGREQDQMRILDLFSLQNGNMLLFLHPEEVQAAVLAIPWHIRYRRPLQYLSFLYFCLAEANDGRAAAWLAEVEEMFARTADIAAPVKERLAGETTLIRAMLSFNDLHAMREDYIKAHAMLGGRSSIVHRDMVWTFGCPHNAYLWLRKSGDYRALVELMERDLHYFHDLTDGCGMGGDLLLRGEYHLERCEFDLVSRLLAAAIRQAGRKGQIATMLAAAFSRARLLVATGREREAVRALEGWKKRVREIGQADLANCFDLSYGYINAILGNHAAIPEWLRTGNIGPSQNVSQMAGFIQIVHAKALLSAGDFAQLDTVAADIPAHLGPYTNLFGRIHAKTLSAVVLHHVHGLTEALHPVTEALKLARPDGIVLTLAEYGGHLLPMLKRLNSWYGDPYFSVLLRHTEQYALTVNAVSHGKVNDRPLTPRQGEMLRLAAKGRTNPQIAQKLGVTPDTVKKTLSSAYTKLKARNRADAVRKYEQMRRNHRG